MSNARPIRIAFPVLGDSMGGAYFSMLELTENLPEGYERVIILHERGVFADYLDERGIPYEVLDHIQNFRRDGRRRWGLKFSTLRSLILPLARYLKEGGFDVVHTQTQAMHKTWAAAGKLAGVPHVWHQHSDGRPKGLERRLTSVVICVSNYVRQDMGGAFSNKTLIVNANPFDVTRFKSVNRQEERSKLIAELNVSPDTNLVGFIANFQPRKRPKLFIEAAALVSRCHKGPVVFVLFGADRSGYKREVQLLATQLKVDARFIGFRSPPESNAAAIDVFVGCSVGEGYGRAPVEAGLVGTPIILSNSGNHPELVKNGENGLLVQSDSAKLLAKAILDTLRDKNLTYQRCVACKRIFHENHDINKYISSIIDIYEKYVNSK